MKTLRPLLLAAVVAASVALTPTASAVTPAISSGLGMLCTLADTAEVACAGDNSDGQLGNGTLLPAPGYQSVSISSVTQLASGDSTTCAVKSDGTVWCWGRNDTYQLGQGGTGTSPSGTPLQVKANPGGFLTDVVQISSQDNFFCALKSDTTVVCWGRGDNGQLGDGGNSHLSLATHVWTGSANLSGVKKVVAGRYFACALMIAGTVKCWGGDIEESLGNGVGGSSNSPVDVLGGVTNAVDIGAGQSYACVVIADASMKCWGSDTSGQQGNGAGGPNVSVATTVPGVSGVQRFSVGYNTVCAEVSGGWLKCWGSGLNGVFMDTLGASKPDPTTLPLSAGFIGIAPTFESTPCVYYRGGAAVCWGYNANSQLGTPPTTASTYNANPATLPVDLVKLAYPGENTAASVPAKAKLDKKKKTYTVTTQLTTTPNILVSPNEACSGAASASAKYTVTTYKTVKFNGKKKRKKVKKTKTIKKNGVLGIRPEGCIATLALKLPVKYFNGKKVKIAVAAAGNGSLQPISTSVRYKLSKVKAKKK